MYPQWFCVPVYVRVRTLSRLSLPTSHPKVCGLSATQTIIHLFSPIEDQIHQAKPGMMVGRVAFEGGGEDCDSAGFPPEKEKDAQIDSPRSLACEPLVGFPRNASQILARRWTE